MLKLLLMGNNNEKNTIKFSRVIFSEDQISKRISEVGKQITKDYSDKVDDGLIVVSILKGAAIFMSDLIRNINLDIEIDFITASSYCSAKSAGKVNIEKDISIDISGKHVIIVEDIIDTGITLKCISNYLKDKGAKSIKFCTFLNKHKTNTKIDVAYTCFDCPQEFIVGYGLDYEQKFRNLPYVTSLECELKD